VFIPYTNQAVTGTNKGIIIVWDISLIMEDFTQPEERRPIKQVNLMSNNNKIDAMKKNSEEVWIKVEGNFLVVGSSNGCVRFYDNQYRIEAWFEDIDIGSIHTISFSSETTRSSKEDTIGEKERDPLAGEPFICPDFIVVDDKARVTLLRAELFEKIDKEDKKGEILLQSIVQPIVATSVRPHFNTIAISC
jgi:WD40 repeat protein